MMTVPGFKFAGVYAGIKRSRKKDLALIFSEDEAVTAGMFTTNRIKAAPVRLDMNRISSSRGRAIIINSGNANACTGKRGYRDAEEMAEITAKELGISPELVYVASTGIIGEPLPMERIRKAIPDAVRRLSHDAMEDVATAIMTTDTFPKLSLKEVRIGSKIGTIAGMAKGAGMIHPRMATMLSFILTDISIEPQALRKALADAVNHSFNMLTVDGDTSTNDTVIIMANGLLGNSMITESSPVFRRFSRALYEVTHELSRMIAMDGEGATRLIEVVVRGAKTESDAERVARAVANSVLVKTAIYGRDANWGRIMAAIGYSGADVIEERISISLNGLRLVDKGTGTGAEVDTRKIFSQKGLTIDIDLHMGDKRARIFTCDLTGDYVRINSCYRT